MAHHHLLRPQHLQGALQLIAHLDAVVQAGMLLAEAPRPYNAILAPAWARLQDKDHIEAEAA